MPNYRRLYLPAQAVFITSNTHQHKRIFSAYDNINLLIHVMENVKSIHPFELLAYTIMPDHIHLLIQTPEDTPTYSPVIHSIKRNFSFEYKKLHRITRSISIWQDRFYDHVIRDDNDFNNHLDYIHYNPVNHRFVQDPLDWKWSSFRNWMDEGFYESGWGCGEPPQTISKLNYE
ncbi:MAG: transposase [Anaerolineaceae bacterium]|nr:transposase [Anaerolineaceae bacterium]